MARLLKPRNKIDVASRSIITDASSTDLRDTILAYLASHNAMTIASCDGDSPWASAVFYANDDMDIYFLSNPNSRHGSNMGMNSKVSVAIHDDPSEWKDIRGIQLEGEVEKVRSPKRKILFWQIYRKKFPFVDRFFQPGSLHEMVKSKIAAVKVYRIIPNRVFYLDNSRGFGHREILEPTSSVEKS